jgi:hypothetical protein
LFPHPYASRDLPSCSTDWRRHPITFYVSLIGSPWSCDRHAPEQWNAETIKRAFATGWKVLEIDLVCLAPNYFGPIKLVLEVNHYLDIPSEIWIFERSGFP